MVERPAAVLEGPDLEAEFEVEQILGQRLRGNKIVEFLVKWKGYGIEEATWEPEANLENSQKILAAFKKRLEAGTAPARRGSDVRVRK